MGPTNVFSTHGTTLTDHAVIQAGLQDPIFTSETSETIIMATQMVHSSKEQVSAMPKTSDAQASCHLKTRLEDITIRPGPSLQDRCAQSRLTPLNTLLALFSTTQVSLEFSTMVLKLAIPSLSKVVFTLCGSITVLSQALSPSKSHSLVQAKWRPES